MHFSRLLIPALAALAGVALLGAIAYGDDIDSAAADDQAAIPRVTITARDYSFDAPATIPSGYVQLTLENAGTEPHHAMIARLKEGVTLEQLMAALEQGPEAAIPLVTMSGGTMAVEPGKSQDMIVNLPEGNYVLVCTETSEDHTPHVARGMVKPFTVAGPAVSTGAPKAGADVEMKDFAFTVPTFTQGETWVKVSNTGAQDHEMVLVRLNDGVGLEDALGWDPAAGSPPPFEMLGGVPPVASGMTQFVKLDLQAGTYMMLCFIPDPASGRPHMELGMTASFTVE